jgi:DNA polymerase III delta prime subunit
MSITQLWVEKYRPKTIDDYVFTNPETRAIVEHWVNEKSIPHILLHGSAGTGKTTLAKILIRACDVEDIDVLLVNGSKEGRKIDWLREKLDSFCATMPFGTFKIVLIDEADYLNNASVQPALRNLMENYSNNVRFILTCNYPHRIIEPLRSRCQDIKIDNTDRTEFTARAATVLMSENVEFDLETLDSYVTSTYPDLRKCLNLLQANSTTGKLVDVKGKEILGTADYKLQAVDLFKQGRFREARQVLCNNARPEEMESIFRWTYDNLDLWSKTPEGQDEAILIIRRGLVNNVSCADAEINLSATITELISIGQ